jgi:nucleotide-binding universal stress UspA family protein
MDKPLTTKTGEVSMEEHVSFNSVFHPSDLSKGDEGAFVHALKLALAARAKLSLLHVRDRSEKVQWRDFPKVRSILIRWKVLPEGCSHDDVVKAGLRVYKVKTHGSDPAATILEHLEGHPTDLVVMATRQRRGFSRWLHKPTAEPIARQSGVMTLFVPKEVNGFISPQDGSVSLRRILVPVDSRPHPQCALDAAAAVALLLGCRELAFNLLHVGSPADMPTLNVPQQPGWGLRTNTCDGDVVEEILKAAAETSVDLIAMATQGHNGFLDALRGSTTEQVLRGCRCPILAVPVTRQSD